MGENILRKNHRNIWKFKKNQTFVLPKRTTGSYKNKPADLVLVRKKR